MSLLWCDHCKNTRPTQRDCEYYLCCEVCGKVLFEDLISDGETSRRENHAKIPYEYSDSVIRTLNKGGDEILRIGSMLYLSAEDSVTDLASRIYTIAVHRNFTRGRKTSQVAAACFYIACRMAEPPKPFLLFDFSETLAINVYVLGSVCLQLCKLLNIRGHAMVKRLVDPTLFFPRFTETLLNRRNVDVSRTAMRMIASMNRDWMQTGEKPSGLCGAALYIAALSHGFKVSKSDIVKIVQICEVTLAKRLIEFKNTDSASLTIEELANNAKELKKCKSSSFESQEAGELLCRHKDGGQPPFAHGLCKSCFEDFIEISGGLEGGSDPPALRQAETMRVADESTKKSDQPDVGFVPANTEKPTELVNETDEDIESYTETSQNVTNNERLNSRKLCTATDGTTADVASDTCTISSDESDAHSNSDDSEDTSTLSGDESDDSDFDDSEEWCQKQDSDATPAQTSAEAARYMLSKKRLSSKINYEALEKCFSGDVALNKKTKVSGSDDDASGRSPPDKENKSDLTDKENNSSHYCCL